MANTEKISSRPGAISAEGWRTVCRFRSLGWLSKDDEVKAGDDGAHRSDAPNLAVDAERAEPVQGLNQGIFPRT